MMHLIHLIFPHSFYLWPQHMNNCTKPQGEKQRPTAASSNLATQCTMAHMSIFSFPTVESVSCSRKCTASQLTLAPPQPFLSHKSRSVVSSLIGQLLTDSQQIIISILFYCEFSRTELIHLKQNQTNFPRMWISFNDADNLEGTPTVLKTTSLDLRTWTTITSRQKGKTMR